MSFFFTLHLRAFISSYVNVRFVSLSIPTAVSLGLTGASQKIASLVATANQAQFQTRALNPVALVRNMHGVSASTAQHVVVTSAGAGAGGDQHVTLIPQSVQLVGASSAAAGATLVSSAGIQQQQQGAPVLQQALTVQAGGASGAGVGGQHVQLQMFPQQVVLQQTQPQQIKLSMPPNSGADQGASAADVSAGGWLPQEAKSPAVHVLVSRA